MIKVMALKILRDISSDIHNADFYTIMVDEATDISNTSQMVLCIRWVRDDLEPWEDFIGLHAMEVINADAIVKVIKDVLLRINLAMTRIRGQCYDGCSTMAGEKS